MSKDILHSKIKLYGEVKKILGAASIAWEQLTGFIRQHYELDEDWFAGNPSHKYHSNLRFMRSGKTLIGLSVREGYFIAYIVLGELERNNFELMRNDLNDTIAKEYDAAQTLRDGKWIAFEVHDDSLIDDLIKLVQVKRKPNRKKMPLQTDNAGRFDLGLSHKEITRLLIAQTI